jgi:hypothetical protein
MEVPDMNDRLSLPFRALRLALGLAATLAGLDKFFNILADWGAYVSPMAAAVLPVSVDTFMAVVGVIEVAVGVTILAVSPRIGAYVASVWLLLVGVNLAAGGHFDVAVRDVVMAVAAFALARASEIKETAVAGVAAGRRGVLLASLAAIGMLSAAPSTAHAQAAQHHKMDASPAASLRQTMRDVWTDHVIWTRAYVVAAVADQPDAQSAATRLLKNQEDIGAAVATFYGKAAGDQLTALLKDHILIAVDLIKHAKSGDKAAFAATDAKWARNGDDIADFLSKANPNWPSATLRQMMKVHLSTTTDQVVARLTKNWEADVRAFDVVYDHILAMADALSEGIIKQFPGKFPAK